jgi:hypothetical protein
MENILQNENGKRTIVVYTQDCLEKFNNNNAWQRL